MEDYFRQHSEPNLADGIAETFKQQYQRLVDDGLNSNEILVYLQQFAGEGIISSSKSAAILAVIMYFFDRCDIFEDPDIYEDREPE